jgi:hypothetical protein
VATLPAADIEGLKRNWRDGHKPDFRLDRLPQLRLEVLSVKPEEAAVLSWRWDIDPPTFTSTNVSISIEHCAKMGTKYLFFDLVSIDQSMAPEELMRSVADLASLYSKIPVIAAYDERNVPVWEKIMRRPWISFEAHAYWGNPTLVTYVGYIDGQGTKKLPEGSVSGATNFEHMLTRINVTPITNTILMILSNQISMGDIRDFKYMLPDFWATTSLCYAKMSKVDYLLSCALLAQSLVRDFRVNIDNEILDQNFSLYSLRETPYGIELMLAGQKIGLWRRSYDQIDGTVKRRWLEANPNAEEIILASIGAKKERDAVHHEEFYPPAFRDERPKRKPRIEIVRVQS